VSSSAAATDMLNAYLRQVVSIHTKMFGKLLFDRHDIAHELAALFEEVGESYLRLCEMISTIQSSEP
jgi:hypothetical protein